MNQQLKTSTRIDVVWDNYRRGSIKKAVRGKRGRGVTRKVAGHVKIPANCKVFLSDPLNKQELFSLPANRLSKASCPHEKVPYITSGTISLIP